MPDPYAEFQQPAAADPYAEFATPVRAQAAPADDYAPLREAYAEKQQAVAAGAPKGVVDEIDARINRFTGLMREADAQRQLEQMGPLGRFAAGAGGGLANVWQHAKSAAHDLGIGPPSDYPEGGDAAYQVAQKAERQQLQQEMAPLENTLSGSLGRTVGEAAGMTPIALATGPAGPVLGSGLAGAGMGALMSEPEDRLSGAAWGGATGLATGALGKLLSAPARGVVKPTREAQQLKDLGVEGITAGQAAPRGAIAHFEQAAESTPAGAAVKAAREELPLNLEHRIIQEAAPPGYKPKLGRNELVADRLSELGSEYSRRYNALIDNGPVPKNSIQYDVLNKAMNPSGRILPPSDIKASSGFVADELAQLDQNNSLATLHKIRSNIGDKSRALQRVNPEMSAHLRDVKNSITGHIEEALKASSDPEAFAKLKALDAGYRKYKTVLDAVPLDPGGPVSITPHRLTQAIRNSMTEDQYARGAGGDLRILARAGKIVTSPPRPTTGALGGVLNFLPFSSTWAVGPLGYATSHYPRAFMGETLPQRVLQKTLMQPVVSGAIEQGILARALRSRASPEEELQEPVPEQPPARVLTRTMKRGR